MRPHAGGLTVDPFPFGLDDVELTGLHVAGRTLDVRVGRDRYALVIDGERHERSLGEVLHLSW